MTKTMITESNRRQGRTGGGVRASGFRLAVALSAGLVLACSSTSWGAWGDVTAWRTLAANGNWNDNNWTNITQGWDNHNPNYEGGRDLQFNNNVQLMMTNNFSGYPGTNRWRMTFASGATSSRTITGNTANTFWDNGGTKPRIENNSSASHGLAFPFRVAYSGGIEINPVSGGLNIFREINTGGYWIDVYGDNNKTLFMAAAVSGAGGIALKQKSVLLMTNNNAGMTGTLWIEKGVLRIQGHTNSLGGGTVNVGTNATLEVNANLVYRPTAINLYGTGTNVAAGAINSLAGGTLPGNITLYQNSRIHVSGSTAMLTTRGTINASTHTLYITNTVRPFSMGAGTINGSKTTDDGAIHKSGTNYCEIRPGTSLSGNIVVQQGELRISTVPTHGGGTISLADGTTLAWSGSDITERKSLAINGNVTLGRNAGGRLTITNAVNLGGSTRTITVVRTNTISGIISNGGLTKTGSTGIGLLVLSGVNTYSGPTTISAGVLELSGAGSIANSTVISIAANATFKVSGLTTELTMASGQQLTVTATGSASPALITTAAGKGINLAANSPLVFNAMSSAGGAPLTVTGGGNLTLASGNIVTVTNTGAALAAGDYKLIAASGGSAVDGSAPTSVTVAGGGIAGGTGASLLISGSELYLRVASATPSITLADNGTQVAAAYVAAGTTAHVLHKFQCSVTVANATLNAVAFTTAGSYAAADLTNLKLRYSTDSTLDGGDATLSTLSSSLGPGAKSFSSLTQVINSGSTGYFFITADIAASPTGGNTINVNAIGNADLTFASGSKSGSATAGGAQTIVALPTVTSPTATSIAQTTATLGANVTSLGGAAALSSRGTVWGTTANPTGNADAEGGTGTGVFTEGRTGFSQGTKYFYRGYAVNTAGTAYSADGSFHTEPGQASSVTFANITASGLRVSWSAGADSDGAIVVMRAGNSAVSDPTDGTLHSANAAFGSGADLGSGSYVVFRGSGTQVDVTGLSAGTVYYVEVFAYKGTVADSGSDQGINYRQTSPAANNQSTLASEPTTHATSLTFPSVASTQMTISWSSGNGANRIVVVKSGGAVDWTPTDGTAPSGVSATFTSATDQGSGNKICYDGSGSSFTLLGLTAGTTYYVKIFEYNGSGALVNYYTGGTPLSGSQATTEDCLCTNTVTYTQQQNQYDTRWDSGGGSYDTGGSTELGMWANGDQAYTVAWKTFRTGSATSSSARKLQVGDEFTIRVYTHGVYYGQLGVSLNRSGSTGNWANRLSGSAASVRQDGGNYGSGGGIGSWYAIDSAAGESFTNTPAGSSSADYTIKFKITSSSTYNVDLDGKTKYDRVLAGSPSSSDRIDAYSIFLNDDRRYIWSAGDNRKDSYWKQTTTVKDTGAVEFGGNDGTSTINGLITDGLGSGCTSGFCANRLYKIGTGIITLGTTTNTYTGGSQVENGTLQGSADGCFGAAPASVDTNHFNIWSTGTLQFSGSFTLNANRGIALGTVNAPQINVTAGNSVNYGGSMVGSANWQKVGAGTLVLTGVSSNSGVAHVAAGMLIVGQDQAAGAVPGAAKTNFNVWSTGTLGFTNVFTLHANRNIELGTVLGPQVWVAPGSTATVNGVILNSAGWYSAGPGTLVLAGNNTFSGSLSVTQGVVRATHQNALGGTGAGTYILNSTAGSALELIGGVTTAAEPLFLNGAGVSSGGALRNVSGNNTYAGAITLQSSGVRIGSDADTLTLNSGTAISGSGYNLTLGGAGNFAVSSAIGTGAGTVTKDGAGTLTLTGTSTFSGAMTISGGAVQIGNNGTAGSVATASIVNNSALAFYRTDSLTYSGAISGSGAVTNLAGTLTLSGNNSYNGRTVVAGGTLKVGHANALGSTTDGTTVNSGFTLDLNGYTVGAEALALSGTGIGGNGALVNSAAGAASLSGNVTLGANTTIGVASGDITLSGAIGGGAFNINKSGAGTLKLTGTSTYSGSTTVSDGTLAWNGTNTSSAVTVNASRTLVGSGSAGALTVSGTVYPGATSNAIGRLAATSLTMNNGSKAVFQIGNCLDTSDRDFISNSGSATINATVTITIEDDVTTNWDNTTTKSWNLIVGGIGSAANFTLDETRWGLAKDSGGFSLSASGGNLVLTFTPRTIDPPAAFSVAPASVSSMTLTFTRNAYPDDVIIVYDTDGTFSDPSGAAPNVGDAFAGGTVVYKGNSSPQTHSSLSSCTRYYYKAWSYVGTRYSATGLTADDYTSTPAAPVSQAGSAVSTTNFTANWSASSGAASYRLDVSTNATFGSSSATTPISENIQSWAAQGSYGSYTEIITAGTVTMTRCIIQPSAAADGPCTTGRVQMEASNGIIELPPINSVVSAIFHLDAGGSSRSVTLEKNVDGGGWTTVATISGIGTSGAVYSNYVGDTGANIKLRLSGPSAALYVHDIIVTAYSGGPSYVGGFSNKTVAGTSQVVTGLVDDTTYYYRVRAVGAGGCESQNSTTQSVTTIAAAPAAPAGLAASDGTSLDHVALSWTDGAKETGYVVWRHTADVFGSATAIYTNAANTVTYNDAAATPGQRYYYWITATNPSGSSAESASDSGYRKLATVTGVAASDGTSTAHVQVDWSDGAGETGYAIWRDTDSDIAGATFVTEAAANATTYNDTGATPGTKYWYWVIATNSTSVSQSDASTPDTGYRKLANVAGVAASDGTSTAHVQVDWTDGAGETGYAIWRDTDSDIAGATFITEAAANATTYNDASATPGQLYYYWVRATNSASVSQSDAGTPDTGYRKLATVGSVAASDDTYADKVLVEWADITGETGYGIYRHTSDASGGSSYIGSVAANATSYEDITATAGLQYYYWVRATNSTSLSQSDFQASGEPGRRASQAAPTVINPTVTSITAGGATLGAEISTNGGLAILSRGTTWGAAPDPTGNEGVEGGTATGVFSHARSGMSAGTFYYYRGWAENSAGRGWSPSGSFWTAPDAPTLNAASALAASSFSANWNAATGATNYLLDASASPTFAGFVNGYQARVIGDVTTFSVTGLTSATTYYWRLRAQNSGGISVYSTTNTALTLCAAPIATAATNWTTNSLYANWNAVSGASDYRLDVATSSDFSGGAAGGLVISEVMDGNRTGGQPKFVEIYNAGSAGVNLNGKKIRIGINGAALSDAYTFGSVTLDPGDAYVVANNSADMTAAGYSAPDATDTDINGNGNDAYALTESDNTVIDVFGTVGNSDNWYADSYAVRSSSVTTGNTTYTSGEWTITGLSSGEPASGTPGTPGSHTAAGSSAYVPGYSNRTVSATTEQVTNLAAETAYYYRVRAVNASGTSTNSNVITAYTLSVEPTAHAGSFAASAASDTRINLSWTAAGAPVDGYLILRRQGADPTGTPTDGVAHVVGNVLGDSTVAGIVAPGTELSTTVSNLTASTLYHFSIVPFNWNGANEPTYNYRTAATIPTANATTFAAEPTTQASAVFFAELQSTSFQVSWARGNGAAVIVVVRQGGAVDAHPSDGRGYTNNAAFGAGTQIGAGNYVAYIGTGTNFTLTGLTSAQTYHVAVYEYNGTDGLQNYRTSDPATGSQVAPTAPTLTTAELTDIAATTATGGGEVTSDGGLSVTRRGVVWNTSGTPTTADFATTNGSGTGSFVSYLENLTPGRTYYVRAYALNAYGTGYGNERSFAALCFSPPAGLYANPTNYTDFTANWGAVSGATGYRLDVSTNTAFTGVAPGLLIDEGFAGGTTPPDGWSFTAIGGTYSSAGNFGRGSPSLQLDATGDAVETPTLAGNPTGVTIWIKGQSIGGNSSLLVEGYDGADWSTVSTIIPTNTAANTNMPLAGSVTKLRFTYTKVNGNLAFDDVIVGGLTGTVSYVPGFENRTVAGASESVTGLTEGVTYFYRVRAVNDYCTSINSATQSVTVKSRPGIGVGPTIYLTNMVGGSVPNTTFAVTNIGGGNLSYVLATNAGWLSIRPTTNNSGLAFGQSQVHTNFIGVAGLTAGTHEATVTFTSTGAGMDAATNSPRTMIVSLTLTNFADPTSVTATADGKELVDLAWTPNGTYGTVMILHKAGTITTGPSQGTSYSVGNTIDGATVIYKGTGSSLEHIGPSGVTRSYRFYSVNGNYYSGGVASNLPVTAYGAGEIVEPFAYTNVGTMATTGHGNGGSGWSGAWSGDTSSFSNRPGSFSAQTNYPTPAANKVVVAPPDNTGRAVARGFSAKTSGKVYAAFIVNYEWDGDQKWAGASLMHGSTEKIFFGECWGGSAKLGVHTTVGTKTMTAGTGNDYIVIMRYDFSTDDAHASAYKIGTDAVPVDEPSSWDVEYLNLGTVTQIDGISLRAGASSGYGRPGEVYFDEVRVSTNWNDLLTIVPTTPDDPAAASASADGNEMVRLAWTKNAADNGVMILHKSSAINTDPTDGVSYGVGDTIDGAKVVYKGSGTKVEHVVAPGSSAYYKFYSYISANYYSDGLGANLSLGSYSAGEIVNPFSYTNDTSLGTSTVGGQGFGANFWATSGSGTWGVKTNYAEASAGSVPRFLNIEGYPEMAGNLVRVTGLSDGQSATADRSLGTAINSGQIYVSFMMAYQYFGSNKWAGVSLCDGSTEKAFFGKGSGNNWHTLGIMGDGTAYWSAYDLRPFGGGAEAHTGNVYLVVGKYDFHTKLLQAKAYNLPTTTFPDSEPSWDVSQTLATGFNYVDRIRLNVGANNGNIGDVYFDEVRVATNWAQLVGSKCPSWIGSNKVSNAWVFLGDSVNFECQTWPPGPGQSAAIGINHARDGSTWVETGLSWMRNENNNSYWSNRVQMIAAGVVTSRFSATASASCSPVYTNNAAITVSNIPPPSASCSATRDSVNTNSQINLGVFRNTPNHDVIVVRQTADSDWTAPTPGVTYYAGETLGNGTVVYRGSGGTVNDTGLASSQTYYYRFYSENWSYYSIEYRSASATTLGGVQTIVVDGNPNDWLGTAPSAYNAAAVSRSEYIWKDKPSEQRTDNANHANADLREFRVYADTTNVYFLVKLQDVTDDQHPYIAISLDTRRSADSGAMNWLGDDAGIFHGGQYFGGVEQVRFAQRNIIVHKADGEARAEMYALDGGSWYHPPNGAVRAISAANNAVEFYINRADLLLTGSVTGRFTVATFLNTQTWANDGDSTVQLAEGTPDAVDSVSIAPYEQNDGNLLMSAWLEEISDHDIDFWFDVKFDAAGVASHVAPTTPVVAFPTNNASVAANPTLRWNASTDSDGGVTGYFLEVGTNSTLNGATGTENGDVHWRVNLPATQTNFSLSTSQTQYWWRVRARDTAGILSGGSINTFRIGGKSDVEGPVPTLLYIGTNVAGYLAGDFDAHIAKYGHIQSVTDAEIRQQDNAIGFVLRWEDSSGVYATNKKSAAAGGDAGKFAWNIVDTDGRVSPNWDLYEIDTQAGTSNEWGYDRPFLGSNIWAAGNSASVITTWVHEAFKIATYDETIEYYLTVSAEDACTESGSWSSYGTWNSYQAQTSQHYSGWCEDGPNTARNVTTNYFIRIVVEDDDRQPPIPAQGQSWAGSRSMLASNDTSLLSASGSGQSVIYTATDGGMTGKPLSLFFNLYDYYSGLQVSKDGLASTNTSLSIGAASWLTNNIANIDLTRSQLADPTADDTVLAWHWSALTFGDMTALWSGDGSGDSGEVNPVRLTMRDRDDDREGDASVASNVVFGYLQVTDDDTTAPAHTQFTIDDIGGYGSTNLLPGNIAIVGVNGNPATQLERFSFVVLAPFPVGTEIHFTDCGWADHNGTNWHRNTEFHTNRWVATGDSDVGTVFELALQDINANGDQVVVYQYYGTAGPSNDPGGCTFLYAINMKGTNTAPQADGWYLPPVPDNNRCSALYRGLTNGVTAVSVANALSVNVLYTGKVSGTASDLLSWIGDSNNWQVLANTTDHVITNFQFSVTGQGNMNWEVPHLTDAQVATGGYMVVNRVRDEHAGLLATNNAYASAPYFTFYNATGGVVTTNRFPIQFANGNTETQALSVAAATGIWDRITLGTYTAQVYVSDNDFDRLNDNRESPLNMPVVVLDDDADVPEFTNLFVMGTGSGLIDAGTIALYTFDADETTPTTNAASVMNNVTAGSVGHLATITTNFSGGQPGFAVHSTSWTAENYFMLDLTVPSGFQLTVTNVSFQFQRSGTGPSNAYIVTSSDAYAAQLAYGLNETDNRFRTNSAGVNISTDSGVLTIRVIGTNATAAGGTMRVDNLLIQGTVTPLPGSGLVSDQDLNQGTLMITARVTDATSGVITNKHPTHGPRFDVLTPSGASLFSQKAFDLGPTNAAQTRGEWASLLATNLVVPFNDIALGVHTARLHVADADNDRPDDMLQYTQALVFTVIDDDTNAPSAGTVLAGLTNSSTPHLHGPMVLWRGEELASAAGGSSNRQWNINDRMMRSADLTNIALHINLYDESGYHRSATEVASNLSVTISGFISGNVSNYAAARSSPNTTNNPAATSVWLFTSFDQAAIASYIDTTSRVSVSVTDADNDRPDDASALADRQLGYIAWRDNDPKPPLLQTPTNRAYTNALFAQLGPSPGAAVSNLWEVSNNPTDSAAQNYRVSDGELAGLSAENQLMLGFRSYDAGDDNVLGLQRGATPTATEEGRILTNTHISIGSVIVSNTANYVEGWSSSIGATRIAAQVPTSYWAFTTFTREQVGEFLPTDAEVSHPIVLHAVDSDNDRPGDQSRTNLAAGSLVVYDDDTTAPTDPGDITVSPTAWTNVNAFTLNFTDSTDASGIKHYRYLVGTPTSITDGDEVPPGRVVAAAIEGEDTQNLFAVDDDDDRPSDGKMSGTKSFTTRLDQTPPPKITGVIAEEAEDPTSEARIRWTPAPDAGDRVLPTPATLSPWGTYRVYYTSDDSEPTTNSSFADIGYDPHLTNRLRDFITLSNLVFDSTYRFKVAGIDKAGNEGELSDTVTIVLPGFNVTQGLARVSSGGIRYSEVFWKAATNTEGGVSRDYDLIWVDGTSFHDGMSNQWKFLQSGRTNMLADTGAVGRTPPSVLPESVMRFYRAAARDQLGGRWEIGRSPRVASEEVYGMKRVRLHRGQNWLALPVRGEVDKVVFGQQTNWVERPMTVERILGFDLPGGTQASDTNATKITWYQAVSNEVASRQIWLADSGTYKQWRTGAGFPQQNVNANTNILPYHQGFVVSIPLNPAITLDPWPELLMVGRIPTNATTHLIKGGRSYNMVSAHLPASLHPSQMNLIESGFKGGAVSTQSDRLRKLNRETQGTGFDVWYNTGTEQWLYASGASAAGFRIGPDDGFLIYTRASTSDWIWTNRLIYTPPTRLMNP